MSPTRSKQQAGQNHHEAIALEPIEMDAQCIQIDDKKIINRPADPNQLVPFNYRWAWSKHLYMSNYVSNGAQEINALRPK